MNKISRWQVNTQPSKESAQPTELRLVHEQDLSALDTLADPSMLTTLTLEDSPVRDLSPLAELTHLTTLDLGHCTQVGDLGPLAGLKELITLDLTGCGRKIRAGRLRALAGLPQLTI